MPGPEQTCGCPECAGGGVDAEQMLTDLVDDASTLVEVDDPLDAELAGAMFVAMSRAAGDELTAAFAGAVLPAIEARGTRAALTLLSAIGAIGGGFLSDRLRRRRPFVLASAVVFGLGAVLMAVAPGTALLFAGSLTCSLGIGAFAAVDQALLLDVLPERDTDAGRFMGITGFATSIPQAAGPFIAPLFLAVGGGEKNYTLLYVVAAACTVLGGLSVLRITSVK